MIINETTNTKTLAEIVADIKEELKEFVATRIAMLRSEMGRNLGAIKMAAPVLVVGIVLLWTAWLAFSAFLVSVLASAFSGYGKWAWVISFLIVAFTYAIAGGLVTFTAVQRLREKGLKPDRTIRVLQQDKLWLQTEAKTQL